MKTRALPYWITTGLFALPLTFSGLSGLSRAPQMVAGMQHLGYPTYFLSILGTWKLLGVVALLVPGFPRLKEWAYAGFTFSLTGAAASHLASGDGLGGALPPVVLLGLLLASWSLRPAARRLPDVDAPATTAGVLTEATA